MLHFPLKAPKWKKYYENLQNDRILVKSLKLPIYPYKIKNEQNVPPKPFEMTKMPPNDLLNDINTFKIFQITKLPLNLKYNPGNNQNYQNTL